MSMKLEQKEVAVLRGYFHLSGSLVSHTSPLEEETYHTGMLGCLLVRVLFPGKCNFIFLLQMMFYSQKGNHYGEG